MNPIDAIAFKQGKVVTITYETPSSSGTLRSYDPATDTWTVLPMNPGGLPIDSPGNFSAVGSRFVSANRAQYFMSRFGLAKIEDVNSVSRNATIPAPLVSNGIFKADAITATAVAQTGGWLAVGNRTAYRFTVVRFGANHEPIESEPSDRIVVDGIGTAAIVSISIKNPWLTPQDAFFRIYRVDTQSVSGADPGDEMFLIKEIVPTGTVGADGYYPPLTGDLVYQDVTPDKTGMIVPLYTNEITGGTAAAANNSAPVAADMVWFKSRMHYVNTIDYGRLILQVIGTGAAGGGGIQEGDFITINGVKFTYRAAPNLSTEPNAIQLYTTGGTTGNIEQTAWATVNAINRYFASVYSGPKESAVLARYISTTSTADVGQILLQSLVPNSNAITFQTSSPNGFDRDYSGGTKLDQNPQIAGWRWSNLGQPEGVPLSNNDVIGDSSAAILRAIAIKDSLFIFKEDGLWSVTDDGSSNGPQLQIVDPTIHLLAPETAIAIDNFIIGLCDQGVVLVSETGAPLSISHQQIEQDLFRLIAYVGQDTLKKLAFSVGYQAEHTFLLALPESPFATTCTKQYVYALQSQTWTSWNLRDVLCGATVPTTNQLVWGRSDGTLWFERKSSESSDYQDVPFTINSPTNTATATLTFAGDLRSGPGNNFAVGDIVQQAQDINMLRQRVVAVSYSNALDQTTVTLNAAPRTAWSTSLPLTIMKAIQCQARFLPITAGAPLTAKDWGDSFLAFRYCDLDFITVSWSSDRTTYSATQSNLEPISSAITSANGTKGELELSAFGAAPFGQEPFGRTTKDVVVKATLPREFSASAMLTPTLTIGNALATFQLAAWNFNISSSQKTGR